MMTIRAYNNSTSDLEGVMALLEELRGSKDAAKFSFYLQDNETYKTSYLIGKNYITLIALIDDRVAGFMIVEHYLNDTANVIMLYVGKDYRRRGIAYQLKTTMEVLCFCKGYKRIVSQVRLNNEESIALNIKSGWRQELDKVYPDYYYWFSKGL